jgi:hypothetical protein
MKVGLFGERLTARSPNRIYRYLNTTNIYQKHFFQTWCISSDAWNKYIPTFDTIQPNQMTVMLLSLPAMSIKNLVISHINYVQHLAKYFATLFLTVATTWMSMRSKRVSPNATTVHPCFRETDKLPFICTRCRDRCWSMTGYMTLYHRKHIVQAS